MVGGTQLLDQFEWDLTNPGHAPEHFAQTLAADVGLSGEFVTAIAEQIREQVDVHLRSLVMLGFTGGTVEHDELTSAFLPAHLDELVRPDGETERFTPVLVHLSQAEVELQEREREREARRRKRQSRGRRGAQLPEREALKTLRTPALYGAQATVDSTTTIGTPTGVPSGSHYPRRAAAAAASAQMALEAGGVGSPLLPSTSVPETLGKRSVRLDDLQVSFLHPGGLGRKRNRTSKAEDVSAQPENKVARPPTRGGRRRRARVSASDDEDYVEAAPMQPPTPLLDPLPVQSDPVTVQTSDPPTLPASPCSHY